MSIDDFQKKIMQKYISKNPLDVQNLKDKNRKTSLFPLVAFHWHHIPQPLGNHLFLPSEYSASSNTKDVL